MRVPDYENLSWIETAVLFVGHIIGLFMVGMAAADPYAGRKELVGPPGKMATVSPHDTNELDFISTCFWVGVSGTVVGKGADGALVDLPAVIAGCWHPGRFKTITTESTATGIRIGSGAGW